MHPSKVFAKLEAVETDFTKDEFVKEPYKTDLLNETQCSSCEKCSTMNTETIDTGPVLEGALNVAEFYRDATVLVTGGTGFIGKVLVEKLLRCFEVKKIFLLIRRKANVSATDRLQQMLEGPVSV